MIQIYLSMGCTRRARSVSSLLGHSSRVLLKPRNPLAPVARLLHFTRGLDVSSNGTTIKDDGTWQTDAEISEQERYARYMTSREWAIRKRPVKERSGGVCERCKINPSTAVHHLTYERIYRERLEDLQDICEACHSFIHGLTFEDPLMPFEASALTVGCSQHSIFKQQVFHAFMVEHASICREIGKSRKWNNWEYLYVDLHGGPGYLPIDPGIPGSPVIAASVCDGVVPFRGIVFEANQTTAESLCEKAFGITVVFGRSEKHIARLAEHLPMNIKRCGLVYADPNTLSPADTSLIDALAIFSQYPSTRYLDILLHVPATTYKRVRGTNKHLDQPCLSEALKRIQKSSVKVSRPDTAQQWTFILMTNSPHPSFGKRMGWHDISSERGQLILDRLSMTDREREQRRPTNYLFDPE